MSARRRAASQVTLPYTIEQANRTLPLIRRIVQDLVDEYAAWQAAVSKFEYASIRSSAQAPDPEADALQRDAQRRAAEIDNYLRELDELGVTCRSYEAGEIDFPGEVGGESVIFGWSPRDSSVSLRQRAFTAEPRIFTDRTTDIRG